MQKRIIRSLSAQMMHHQNSRIVGIRYGFQSAHILIIPRVNAAVLGIYPHFLQRINDDKSCFRMFGKEQFQFKFKPFSDGFTACLKIQPARNGRFRQLGKAVLNSFGRILQTQIKHSLRLNGPSPNFPSLRQL